MTTLQNLDMNVYKQIAERMKAERDEAAKRKSEARITPQTSVTPPKIINHATAKEKFGYVYVPSLRLYVSENRHLQGMNWDQAQNKLHQVGKRMPTIPEFIEFLKYLRSDEGQAKVPNASNILDEIYKVGGNSRSEWLDARFEEKKDRMYVSNYVFDSKGKIIQKQEKLEDYLTENRIPGIDLDSWLANPTKQGLPNSTCPDGQLYYLRPSTEKVAWFVADSDWAGIICEGSTIGTYSLGVRYVESRTGNTEEKK